jgi:RNA ligase (TIGR02306 family)
MRKLATIQAINHLEPIPNADAIERARILGWWVVVKKGDFRVGDRVVYCEIDSLLPERPEFEFLRPSCFKPGYLDADAVVQPGGFRIKTVKLRGQVSQGICFPLSILPPEVPRTDGIEVTDLLGIRKYEPPVPAGLSGRVKGGFPGFLPKTDEIRVQVLEGVLERHRGKQFAMTEKLDGTSFTAFLHEGKFGICSRNLWLDETDESSGLVRLAIRLKLDEKLRSVAEKRGFQPAVQGEVIGPGIQKNKYDLKAVELRIFNVLDIDTQRLVDRATMHEILQEVDLASVPEVGTFVLNHSIDELVEMSAGVSVLNAKAQREGLVLRPMSEEYDPDLAGRLSFKVINPKFLLKYDE